MKQAIMRWKVIVRGTRFGYMGDVILRELMYHSQASAERIAKDINTAYYPDPRNREVATVEPIEITD